MNAPPAENRPVTGADVARSRADGHLRHASSFLEGKRWREAEVELLRALDFVPGDNRALRLLALVRFKLGRLDEAESVCRELVAAAPQDPSLRLKLGLIALKLDRAQEAVNELEIASRLLPSDQRVWTYLGFAYARTGDTIRAAAAFQKGGQDGLAAELKLPGFEDAEQPDANEADGARPEEERALVVQGAAAEAGIVSGRAGGDAGSGPRTFPSPEEAAAVLGDGRIIAPAVGLALPDDSLDDVEEPVSFASGPVPVAAEPAGPLSPPVAAPAGVSAVAAPPAAPVRSASSQPVLSLLSFTLSRLGAVDRMPSQQGGSALRLDFTRELHARSSAVVAVAGQVISAWAQRREQGRLTDAALGEGAHAFVRFAGDGEIVLAEPAGVPVILALDDDILYLRLPHLLAFDADVLWEAGRIPRTQLDMVQFRGDGRVVMALVGHPTALKVTPSTPVVVAARNLVGWAGRIVARGVRPGEGPTRSGPAAPLLLQCEGEGVVLADLFPPPLT